MSTVKTLKTYLGADLRRFPIVGGALPSLAVLKAQLAAAYGLASSSTLVLKYVDEDGEQVTAANDQDLADAISIVQQEGSAVLRLHIIVLSGEAASASTPVVVVAAAPEVKTVVAEVKTAPVVEASSPAGSSSAPAPVQVATAAPAVASEPKVAVSTPSSASASASSSPKEEPKAAAVSAESVLELLRSFFNDASVTAALPAAVCLFVDSLLTSGVELADAIRFTLDAFPVVKSHPLVVLALQYTDVAVPFLESALAPLRALAATLPPEVIQGQGLRHDVRAHRPAPGGTDAPHQG
jgi:hypothetical protein